MRAAANGILMPFGKLSEMLGFGYFDADTLEAHAAPNTLSGADNARLQAMITERDRQRLGGAYQAAETTGALGAAVATGAAGLVAKGLGATGAMVTSEITAGRLATAGVGALAAHGILSDTAHAAVDGGTVKPGQTPPKSTEPDLLAPSIPLF